jgi:glucokinase
MCALLEEMTTEVDVIGISCGGPLDSKRGVILSPPHLIGWDQVEIVSYLKKRYGVEVFLQNDANACAVAEWKYGAGKGCTNMVFLTFGTGLGAGLILNGKLYSGACGMAGEVGHIRLAADGPVGFGKAGSFEGFCSGGGIARLGKAIIAEELKKGNAVAFLPDGNLDLVTAKLIGDAAEQGDELAKRIYRESAEKLGMGLSFLIDIFNPERIVIGSVFARSEELFRETMEAVIEREALEQSRKLCRVVPAALGERIGDVAALSVAIKDAE